MLWGSFGVPFGVDCRSFVSFRALVVVAGVSWGVLEGSLGFLVASAAVSGISREILGAILASFGSILDTFCCPKSPSGFY